MAFLRLDAAVLRGEGLDRLNRQAGSRRAFNAGVLERLTLIAMCCSAGFSLDEIAHMFGSSPSSAAILRAAFLVRLDLFTAVVPFGAIVQ